MRSAKLVGVAQPVACCEEVGGVGRRREIAQRRMRSTPIVIIGPFSDPRSGMIEAEEQALIEKLGLRQQAHQFVT